MMIAIFKLCLTRQFNFAILPLSPTLSRLRERGLKSAHIGVIAQNTTYSHLRDRELKPYQYQRTSAKHNLLPPAGWVVKTSQLGNHALARQRERVLDRAGEGQFAHSQKA